MAIDIATARTEIAKIYIAAFNRVPDSAGLAYWVDVYANKGASLDAIAGGFAGSTEYTTKYPAYQTNAEYVNAIYLNVFGRASDTAGATFWAGKLADGSLTHATMMNAMLNAAATNGSTDGAKVANQATFAVNAVLTNLDITSATNQLGTITSDTATIATATAATAAVVTGTTFVLTAGGDTMTGGASNDVFIGNTAANAMSFSTFDVIDGGAGTDTLNFSVIGTLDTTAALSSAVKNIEIANLVSTTNVIANTSAWTGLTALNTVSDGGANVTVATTAAVTAANTGAGAVTLAGGLSQTVSTVNNVVLSGSTGAIKTASSAMTAASTINGGTAVTVTNSGVTDAGTLAIGATSAATGAVTVNSTSSTVNGTVQGTIAVTGGTTVTVTQAGGNAVNTTTTAGAVTVAGTATTTAVTVNDDAAKAAATTVIGRVNGAVTVNDVNAASATAAGTIATVSLNSFAAATIDSSALTTVNLSGTGTSLGMGRGDLTATPTANTLTVNLNGLTLTGALTDSEAATDDGFTTVNIASSTAASTLGSLALADATTLSISGDAKFTSATETLNAVTAINVTNTAGASFGTAIGTGVTFTGGAGADSVKLTAAFTKASTMGDGSDTVTYALQGTGGSVDFGTGAGDKIIMTDAQGDAADADTVFNSKFTNFEILELSTIADATARTIDLANIGNVSQVRVATGGTVTLNKLAAGGTFTLTAASTKATIGIINTNTTSDVLNVGLAKAAAGIVTYGTIEAANTEIVNIASADAVSGGSTAAVDTLTLTATAATSIVVTGNNGLTLTATGSDKVTNFDASAVIGNGTADTAALLAVTFASVNTTATATVSIKGGAGDDALTGNAGLDTISGGAGNDTIVGGAGADTLNGGDGTNIITGGDGIDTINLSSGGVDTVSLTGVTLTANRDNITGFTSANDKLGLDIDYTDAATTAGSAAVVLAAADVVEVADTLTYKITDIGSTATTDIFILAGGNEINADLSASTNGSELLKYLATSGTASSITVSTDLDMFFIAAYDAGNTYIYQATDSAIAGVLTLAEDIQLVAVLTGVQTVVAADFTMVA